MNFKNKIPMFIGIVICCMQIIIAQDQKTNQSKNKPLTWSLNKENTHWIKLCASFQVWGRITENNPGSMVDDDLKKSASDISLRRVRVSTQIKPSDRLFVFFQIGTNNINSLSDRGPAMNVLDLYSEYKITKNLFIGAGKSGWDGLSRYTSSNSSKQMNLDLPFVALPTLNITDDLTRKLSIYAKGQINRLDYRLLVAKPYAVAKSKSFDPDPYEGIAKFTDNTTHLEYSGYLKYGFLEQESNTTFSHVGTYLGTKKVLNIGAGFTLQQDALWSLSQGEIKYHDMALLAMDLFLDIPLHPSKKTALTYYSAYFKYDFGPNYVRNIGANNPANAIDPTLSSFNGKGNSFPIIGTGTTFLNQLGYLFTTMGTVKSWGQLQPYTTIQYSDYEYLEDPMVSYDIGVNWFLDGHKSKFTLHAQNRPVFMNQDNRIQFHSRKWMVVLQYQFRIQ